MSKIHMATLEAKMAVRTSRVFSLGTYRPGVNPRRDVLIEGALSATAEGKPWTRRFRVPRARRPAPWI